LEQVVVAFGGMVTGREFWIKARRSFVEGFSGRELPEAEFKGKYLKPISGTEGSGEGFPVLVFW
jgi:hypothetical protein